jgi:GxxExxY protein
LGQDYLKVHIRNVYFYRLKKEGYLVEKEKPMPLIYEEVKLDCGYRIDILVENKVVIEIKSIETLNDVHLAQILTNMKLGKYKLGLLINFNVSLLKDGIRRVVNRI